MSSNGAKFWTLVRIMRDNQVGFTAIRNAVERAGVAPAYSINEVGYFDDASRELIERALNGEPPAGAARVVAPVPSPTPPGRSRRGARA